MMLFIPLLSGLGSLLAPCHISAISGNSWSRSVSGGIYLLASVGNAVDVTNKIRPCDWGESTKLNRVIPFV